MGKVTAINETQDSAFCHGSDSAAHAPLWAGRDTTLPQRARTPIDPWPIFWWVTGVRVEGAVKGWNLCGPSVTVMGMPPGGTPTVPRDAAPQPPRKPISQALCSLITHEHSAFTSSTWLGM